MITRPERALRQGHSERRAVLGELARLAQQRIFEQRSYEFRISLAIWGALAAAIAGLARADALQIPHVVIVTCTVAVCAVILFVYWYWLSRLVRRYDLFKEQLKYCQSELASLANVHYPTHLKGEASWSRSLGLDWGTWPKFLLALVLSLTAVTFAIFL